MTRSLYIIGAPGAGKSTAMAQVLEGWAVGPYQRWTSREMFGHYLTHPEKGRGAYLGHLRPEYPGTDALSLSVAPQALLWLDSLPLLGLDWVFGEGVRLSHLPFLTALAEATDLSVVYLRVDPEVAAQRRLARGGKQLGERFCKAMTTKAHNVALGCDEAGIKVLERVPDLG